MGVCGCKSLLKRRKQISRLPHLDADVTEIITLMEFLRVEHTTTERPNGYSDFSIISFDSFVYLPTYLPTYLPR